MAMVDSDAVVVVIVFLVHTMVVLYDEVLVVLFGCGCYCGCW